jgi:MerR family transcriptional regulator, mercuric resistance operon regulatory protein
MRDERELTIGALAEAAGVGVETVRYYQRRGLLAEPRRPVGGIRRYGTADVARLKFVKAAQRLGFSLDEVAELLRLEDGTRCAQARVLAEGHLGEIRQRLRDLRRVETTLARLVQQCESARGTVSCPLIAALGAP